MKERIKQTVEEKFRKIVNADPNIHHAHMLIHSDRHNIHWTMAHGQDGGVHAHPDQPYHTASMAKSFTAAMIAMLVQEGKLRYSDPIANYLPEGILKGLHIYKGRDYSGEIRIEQLVDNTSGLPDYYEGKTEQGRFLEVLLKDPMRKWTPEETVEWSKKYLRPKFAPGQGIHYSNTNFNLLGLIIENVTSMRYEDALHAHIFQPLNMDQSYLLHFSEPAVKSPHRAANLNLLGRSIDLDQFVSSSSTYAAGQAVSTSEDLLKFMQALKENRLISESALATMMQWKRMRIGIDYGYGLMRVRMMAFSPKYNVWGHLGSTGALMLYNPALDTYLIGSFNRTGVTGLSIRYAFSVLRSLQAIKKIETFSIPDSIKM